MNRTTDPALNRIFFLAALAGAILNFIAFYPGILHHDAWAYFDAARHFEFTNWQPPLLGYLWIPLQKIYDGPQPMLVLFVAGYWIGFLLLARAYATESRAIGAWRPFARTSSYIRTMRPRWAGLRRKWAAANVRCIACSCRTAALSVFSQVKVSPLRPK